jgi:hypothetical protein
MYRISRRRWTQKSRPLSAHLADPTSRRKLLNFVQTHAEPIEHKAACSSEAQAMEGLLHDIIYLVGLVVVVLFILSVLGLR